MEEIAISCSDGVVLGGHVFRAGAGKDLGVVVINPATGVPAGYYHFYARFLAAHGFDVITYDYRGIGRSRLTRLKGNAFNWRDWGERDFDAVLRHAAQFFPGQPISVVGHSIGGVLPGYSESASTIHRMLTMGAQYAYWRDYHSTHRSRLFLKWQVVMPMLTALFGYFPGRRLDWLEDLPSGVAYQWAAGCAHLEARECASERRRIRAAFASVTAPILAVGVTDDEFGTKAAISRALDYFSAADVTKVMLSPDDLSCRSVGHFDLFHARHAAGFWLDTLLWLRDGINPWPGRCFE